MGVLGAFCVLLTVSLLARGFTLPDDSDSGDRSYHTPDAMQDGVTYTGSSSIEQADAPSGRARRFIMYGWGDSEDGYRFLPNERKVREELEKSESDDNASSQEDHHILTNDVNIPPFGISDRKLTDFGDDQAIVPPEERMSEPIEPNPAADEADDVDEAGAGDTTIDEADVRDATVDEAGVGDTTVDQAVGDSVADEADDTMVDESSVGGTTPEPLDLLSWVQFFVEINPSEQITEPTENVVNDASDSQSPNDNEVTNHSEELRQPEPSRPSSWPWDVNTEKEVSPQDDGNSEERFRNWLFGPDPLEPRGRFSVSSGEVGDLQKNGESAEPTVHNSKPSVCLFPVSLDPLRSEAPIYQPSYGPLQQSPFVPLQQSPFVPLQQSPFVSLQQSPYIPQPIFPRWTQDPAVEIKISVSRPEPAVSYYTTLSH